MCLGLVMFLAFVTFLGLVVPRRGNDSWFGYVHWIGHVC